MARSHLSGAPIFVKDPDRSFKWDSGLCLAPGHEPEATAVHGQHRRNCVIAIRGNCSMAHLFIKSLLKSPHCRRHRVFLPDVVRLPIRPDGGCVGPRGLRMMWEATIGVDVCSRALGGLEDRNE